MFLPGMSIKALPGWIKAIRQVIDIQQVIAGGPLLQ